MYDSNPASAAGSIGSIGNSTKAQQIYAQSQGLDTCVDRSPTAAETIFSRLSNLRDHASQNTQRIIEQGARAFGGSQIGAKEAGRGQSPQPAGHMSTISTVLDDLQSILILQSEAIGVNERIV